ncbi:CLUMA_CG015029, isoform A [Clunio marinus]|uniref:CLUMA_CG015029, isoform A n=1 Tax=Clunio marinus TaxID=568069 RepID=A0A1J1INK4_9DIPT|nr:CLUMA_CG015029, isoform A [Clunio marinus]
MWTKTCLTLILLFVGFFNNVSSQELFEVRLVCEFGMYPINEFFNYACIVRNVTFDFSNPFYYIIIEGEHESERTNADVLNFVIQSSNVNAIPANIFQVFPNIVAIEGANAGVSGINPPDFTFATQIRGVFANSNIMPRLTGSPFFVRSTITHLNLYSNQIEFIANTFFFGLVNLRYLSISGNSIEALTPEMMAPLANLRILLASDNRFETLSGRIFANNRNIEFIGLEYNNINAIGPNAFDNLPNLEYLGLSQNACVDETFELNDVVTIETVNQSLQQCFNNSVPEPPRTRGLLFEVRGNMTFFDEYNDELLRIEGRW